MMWLPEVSFTRVKAVTTGSALFFSSTDIFFSHLISFIFSLNPFPKEAEKEKSKSVLKTLKLIDEFGKFVQRKTFLLYFLPHLFFEYLFLNSEKRILYLFFFFFSFSKYAKLELFIT